MSVFVRSLICSTILMPVFLSTLAQAQAASADSPAPAASESQPPAPGTATQPDRPSGSLFDSLDDIVVTARKKDVAERAQDVPVSITAIGAKTIEAAKIRDLVEVANLAPSVRLVPSGTTAGYGSFFIRGTGVSGSIPSNDPAVGTFVDGVPLGIGNGSLTEFFELQSVEILRGPQGTLFGKNVTGGAILLTTKRPTNEFGGFVRAGYGNDGQYLIAGNVEGPIVDDKVLFKVAALQRHTDGAFHNSFNDSRIGERTITILRPTLVVKPTETLTITGIYEHGYDRGDGAATQNVYKPQTIISQTYDPRPLGGKFFINQNEEGFGDLKWNNYTVNAELEVGSGKITSITGWRTVANDALADSDGTPFTVFHLRSIVSQRQFYQELRYAGTPFGTDAIDVTAGGNYFNQHFNYQETRALTASNIGANGIVDHKQYAAFAQADMHVTDTFTATAGLRYTREKKEATVASLGNCNFALTACTYDFTGSKTFSNVTPKFGLQWKPNRDFLAYASYTKGYRSGGFNVRNGSPLIPAGPYDDETVQAYEAGIKTELLDNRLRLNVAGYLNQFSNLQAVVLDSFNRQRVQNAANVDIWGFEIDAVASITRSLTLSGGVGYVDNKFSSFNGLELDGVAGIGPGDAAAVKKLGLVQVPHWTASSTLTYEREIAGLGKLTLRGSYSYVGRRPGNVTNAFVVVGQPPVPFFSDSYQLVDLSADLDISEHLSVGAYVKNLTNERWVGFESFNLGFFQSYLSPPRNIMAEVTYKF